MTNEHAVITGIKVKKPWEMRLKGRKKGDSRREVDRKKRSRYCKGTRLPGRRHLENTMRLTERKGARGTGWTGRRETLGMRLAGKGKGPQNLTTAVHA